MKRLLLTFLFLLFTSPVWAAWSLIASTCQTADTAGANYTTTAINTTGADLLVALMTAWGGSTTPTLSDSKTNTWTALTGQPSSDPKGKIWYAYNATVSSGSADHTFTVSTPDSSLYSQSVCVLAFSGGKKTADPIDQSANGIGNLVVATVQPGSITTAFDNELVVTGISASEGNTVSVDSGFSTPVVTPTNNPLQGIAYKSGIALNTTINLTWTVDIVATTNAPVAYVASFQAVPSGITVRHKVVMQ